MKSINLKDQMIVVEVAIFALKTLLAYLFFQRFVKPCYI